MSAVKTSSPSQALQLFQELVLGVPILVGEDEADLWVCLTATPQNLDQVVRQRDATRLVIFHLKPKVFFGCYAEYARLEIQIRVCRKDDFLVSRPRFQEKLVPY